MALAGGTPASIAKDSGPIGAPVVDARRRESHVHDGRRRRRRRRRPDSTIDTIAAGDRHQADLPSRRKADAAAVAAARASSCRPRAAHRKRWRRAAVRARRWGWRRTRRRWWQLARRDARARHAHIEQRQDAHDRSRSTSPAARRSCCTRRPSRSSSVGQHDGNGDLARSQVAAVSRRTRPAGIRSTSCRRRRHARADHEDAGRTLARDVVARQQAHRVGREHGRTSPARGTSRSRRSATIRRRRRS